MHPNSFKSILAAAAFVAGGTIASYETEDGIFAVVGVASGLATLIATLTMSNVFKRDRKAQLIKVAEWYNTP